MEWKERRREDTNHGESELLRKPNISISDSDSKLPLTLPHTPSPSSAFPFSSTFLISFSPSLHALLIQTASPPPTHNPYPATCRLGMEWKERRREDTNHGESELLRKPNISISDSDSKLPLTLPHTPSPSSAFPFSSTFLISFSPSLHALLIQTASPPPTHNPYPATCR
ncbi:hypothetical protein RYX36_018655, partial [Vicia faba]